MPTRVRIEDYQETRRGPRVEHPVSKDTWAAPIPLTLPLICALEACR